MSSRIVSGSRTIVRGLMALPRKPDVPVRGLRARQTIVESGLGMKAGGGDSLLSWGVVVLGMIDEDSLQRLQKRNARILPQLYELQRWLFAAAEPRPAGHGG